MPDGHGGLARFCQQCTRLEPLSYFEGTRRSCRSSLAKRQVRMSAARRRNNSASDGHLSSSDSDGGGYGDEEEEAGTSARRWASRRTAASSPAGSVSPLRRKRSRSGSPPRPPLAPPAARPAAAGTLPGRPLAATFPGPAGALQPRQSGEQDDSSATALLGLLLPSVLAGLHPPAGGLPLPAAPGAAPGPNDAAAFLASLSAPKGSGSVLPLLDGSSGSAAAAVAAAVAAAATPVPSSGGAGPQPLPLPSDPHELRHMLSTLLQLQALVSSVIIPQVQQRLAAMEVAAALGTLGQQEASLVQQQLLQLAQSRPQQAAAVALQAAASQPVAIPPQLARASSAPVQDAALARLLGSLASQQAQQQQQPPTLQQLQGQLSPAQLTASLLQLFGQQQRQ